MRLTRAQRKSILLKARLQELISITSNRKTLEDMGLYYHQDDGCVYLDSDHGIWIDPAPMTAKYFEPHKGLEHKRNGSFYKEFLAPADTILQSAWGMQISKEIERLKDNGKKVLFPANETVSCHALGVFSFARIIGLNPARVRYLIDYEYQSNRPGFNTLILKPDYTDEFMHEYGGLYSIYRRDFFPTLEAAYFEGKSVVTKGAVSVRYPIPHKRSVPHRNHRSLRERIRTKMVFPLYPKTKNDARLLVGKYDGFVAPTQDSEDYLLWLMELRGFSEGARDQAINKDFAMLYSAKMQHVEQDQTIQYMYGGMLTQSQEKSRFPVLRQFVMMKNTKFSVKEVGNLTDKSTIYSGGYFSLMDENEKLFNERDLTREDVGFILNDETYYTRDRQERPLSDQDNYALEILNSPEIRKMLVPDWL